MFTYVTEIVLSNDVRYWILKENCWLRLPVTIMFCTLCYGCVKFCTLAAIGKWISMVFR